MCRTVLLGPINHLLPQGCSLRFHLPHLVPQVFFSYRIRFQNGSGPHMLPCPEFAVTVLASRPVDVFIDLTANSTLGVMILSIGVKIALWMMPSNEPAFLPIFLSRHFFRRLNIHYIFIGYRTTAKIFHAVFMASRTIFDHNILPATTHSVTSINVLIEVVFLAKYTSTLLLFLRVEFKFALSVELHL